MRHGYGLMGIGSCEPTLYLLPPSARDFFIWRAITGVEMGEKMCNQRPQVLGWQRQGSGFDLFDGTGHGCLRHNDDDQV